MGPSILSVRNGGRVAALAVISWGLYHLYIFLWVFLVMKKSTAGRYGEAITLTDGMRERYPSHFAAIQSVTKLPIPNLEAQAYYERHRLFFEEEARKFELHPYWAANEALTDGGFPAVVHERMKAMLRQLRKLGRRDFALEKDRCLMYEFLRRKKLPHCALLRVWRRQEDINRELDAVVASIEQWPLFLKACHLTQFSSKGTRSVTSARAFEMEREEIFAYIQEKWDYRSKDTGRVWQLEGDLLTAALDPGFLLQAPMSQNSDSGDAWTVEGRSSVGLVEVRAEVFWGHVYLVVLDAVYYYTRDGDVHSYGGLLGGVFHQPEPAPPRALWIRDEGYLPCVFNVASGSHVLNGKRLESI